MDGQEVKAPLANDGPEFENGPKNGHRLRDAASLPRSLKSAPVKAFWRPARRRVRLLLALSALWMQSLQFRSRSNMARGQRFKDISFPSCMRAFACICRMCGSSYDGVPHLEDGAFPALMLRRNRSRNAPFPGR